MQKLPVWSKVTCLVKVTRQKWNQKLLVWSNVTCLVKITCLVSFLTRQVTIDQIGNFDQTGKIDQTGDYPVQSLKDDTNLVMGTKISNLIIQLYHNESTIIKSE